MQNQELSDKLDALENKIRFLLVAHQQTKEQLKIVQEENQVLKNANNQLKSLQEENEELKNLIEKQNQELNNFKYRDKISKLVETLEAGDKHPEELKLVLEEYISKINSCIAYLSRQV